MCDDIDVMLDTLTANGIEVSPVTEARWGRRASVKLPSGSELPLYQPRPAVAYDLDH